VVVDVDVLEDVDDEVVVEVLDVVLLVVGEALIWNACVNLVRILLNFTKKQTFATK
jgi:hypothetical protein